MNPSHSRALSEPLLFERLVRETREDLLAYAMRRSANIEDAADVVSETYLIAWQKLESVPPGETARLWLFGVAANVLRRGAQRRRSSEMLVERLTRDAPELAQIESREREDATMRALRACLERLPRRDQELLLLSAWEELTPKQIATVTGVSTNVVRVRLHRVRSQLKRRLTETRMPSTDPKTTILSADTKA